MNYNFKISVVNILVCFNNLETHNQINTNLRQCPYKLIYEYIIKVNITLWLYSI